MKYDFKNNRELIHKTAKRYHMSMNKARKDFILTQKLKNRYKDSNIYDFMTRTKAVEMSEELLAIGDLLFTPGRVVFDEEPYEEIREAYDQGSHKQNQRWFEGFIEQLNRENEAMMKKLYRKENLEDDI